MIPVLQHAVSFIEEDEGIKIDWILLLQPTVPLRKVSDIKTGIKLALENDSDSAISVEPVFSHHHPPPPPPPTHKMNVFVFKTVRYGFLFLKWSLSQ